MTSSVEPIIEVKNLTKIYGREFKIANKTIGRRVVGCKEVSFTVTKGEIFGFLGPNGAGKTTTIRSMMDYLNIQAGKITIFGLDHRKESLEIREKLGHVPGDLALYDNFTGNELIRYFANYRPLNQEFLEELTSVFKVNLKQKIGTLSKGNKQQVGLIVALSSKPELLIMDEPTIGLDPLMTAGFHKILKKMRKEYGTTIFLSSHDLAEVQTVCDRVGIIKEGKMILVEQVEQLKEKFLQDVTLKFSSKNVPKLNEMEKMESVISVNQINEKQFRLKVKEDVNELIGWLSNYEVKRINIKDADLEEIFLQFYK